MDSDQAIDEARDQKACVQVVGYGCLLALAAALALAAWAVVFWLQHREDEAVAAYSLCEYCGLVLDATNVHARCAGQVAEVSHE